MTAIKVRNKAKNKVSQAKWAEKNKDHRREYQRAYREKNRKELLEKDRLRRLKKPVEMTGALWTAHVMQTMFGRVDD